MSRASRLLVLAAAWVAPALWVVAGLLVGPSDGTSVTSSPGPTGTTWGDSVLVARTFGETPLLPGDEVMAVEERTLADWVGGGGTTRPEIGDVVRYEVRRRGPGLDRIQQVDVTLTRYDVGAAVRAEPQVVLLSGLLLLVGSVVFWTRPGGSAARAYLAATALLPAVATSAPFGPGVIDLAGAPGCGARCSVRPSPPWGSSHWCCRWPGWWTSGDDVGGCWGPPSSPRSPGTARGWASRSAEQARHRPGSRS